MSLNKDFKSKFSRFLLRWDKKKNDRQMPWKGEKDPYKIWLSEIILQQTRVEQGWVYYKKFVENYPTVQLLAVAPDTEVYKSWEGLGYYNRCKNLLESARYISEKLDGVFPGKYEDILSLKGVGTYTAAAISSFAFNFPYAVLDGNVFRVLARIFGIKKAINAADGKKYFTKLASELLHKKQPGIYNQALMDFGAVVCKPVNPICPACVFKNNCYAFKNDLIREFPLKEKKNKVRNRWFYYIVLEYKNRIYIKKRTGNDIWKNLYEFVLIETDQIAGKKKVLNLAIKKGFLEKGSFSVQSVSSNQSQQLSHQKITGQFIRVKLQKALTIPGLKAVSPNQLVKYPFPRFINAYLFPLPARH